jgi:LuxR family maltose regulon positive regulatory protein
MHAQEEGYIRLFVDEGATVEWLLWKILALHRKGQLPSVPSSLLDYVRQLLAAFKTHASVSPVSPPQEQQALIEPLSEREREILQWLATGATTQEIAQRLLVAVGTVKAHLHTIYGKLNVRNRTQAIAAARAAGLLEE